MKEGGREGGDENLMKEEREEDDTDRQFKSSHQCLLNTQKPPRISRHHSLHHSIALTYGRWGLEGGGR